METVALPTLCEKSIPIDNSHIFYREIGTGDPIVFLHGVPTSSYLWRHIMPEMASYGRCIAPDMIGMGQSGKPAIAYTIDDHIYYIHQFIKALGLTNITLVMHAWGSIIGFEYARLHPDSIKGLAFYESHLKVSQGEGDIALPVAELVSLMKQSDNLYAKVMDENAVLTNFLEAGMVGALSESDYAVYADPFRTVESRKVLLQYVNELPFGRRISRVATLIEQYSTFLQTTKVPKLLLYAIPGFTTSIGTIHWARENLSNLRIMELGDGMHFAQETNPARFAACLQKWYETLS
jgi:haloalkane dehalogenase